MGGQTVDINFLDSAERAVFSRVLDMTRYDHPDTLKKAQHLKMPQADIQVQVETRPFPLDMSHRISKKQKLSLTINYPNLAKRIDISLPYSYGELRSKLKNSKHLPVLDYEQELDAIADRFSLTRQEVLSAMKNPIAGYWNAPDFLNNEYIDQNTAIFQEVFNLNNQKIHFNSRDISAKVYDDLLNHEQLLKVLIDYSNIDTFLLFKSIEQEDLRGLKKLIALGVNINQSKGAFSALGKAVSKKNVEMVKALVEAGAKNFTLLHIPSGILGFEVVSYFIKKFGVSHIGDDIIGKIIDRHYKGIVQDKKILHKLLNENDHAKIRFFHKSIQKEDLEVFKEVLQSGVDVNQKIGYESALKKALSKNNFDIVKMLVEAGAELHKQNTLYDYIIYGRPRFEIVSYLIKMKGVSYVTEATMERVIANYYELLIQDSKLFHNLLESSDYAKTNFLFSSIKKEDLKTLKEVIQSGVDLNQQDSLALHRALLRNNFAMIKMLVEAGAEFHGRTLSREYLLYKNIDFEIILYIIEMSDISHFRREVIDAIIGKYYQSLVQDKKSFHKLLSESDYAKSAFLFTSVLEENLETLKELIRLGVDINQKKDSESALERALEKNNLAMIEMLIEAGADIDQGVLSHYILRKRLDFRVASYLIGAIGISHVRSKTMRDIVGKYYQSLIEDKQFFHDLLDRSDHAKTAFLFKSIEKEDMETLKKVIQSGVDIDQKKDGHSPLKKAILKDNFEMIEMLVTAGADLNSNILVHPPNKKPDFKIVLYLIEKMGYPNIDNKDIDRIINSYYNTIVGDKKFFQKLFLQGNDHAKTAFLFKSIEKEDLETLKKVIQLGVDVNQKKGGRSPLKKAIHKNSFEMVQVLVEKGANPMSAIDSRSKTALHYAAREQSDIRIISYLKEKIGFSHIDSKTKTLIASHYGIDINEFVQYVLNDSLEGVSVIKTQSLGKLRYRKEIFRNKKIVTYEGIG